MFKTNKDKYKIKKSFKCKKLIINKLLSSTSIMELNIKELRFRYGLKLDSCSLKLLQ